MYTKPHNTIAPQIRQILFLVILFFSILAVNSIYAAWTAPAGGQPSSANNSEAPLNTGSSTQSKDARIDIAAPGELEATDRVTADEFCLSASTCIETWPFGGAFELVNFDDPINSIIRAQGIVCWNSTGGSVVTCGDQVHAGHESRTKVCQEAGYSDYIAVNTGSYTSPGNNYVIKWNESAGQWRREPADWSGNNWRIDKVRCVKG